jgi:protein-L-isoaspartate(D-aspartate) O-methyltransferase
MKELIDSYRHKGLRKLMVKELKDAGVKNEKVLEAINNIPRHYFLASAFLEFAYENKAFSIGAGQTISQPLTVALQTELLDPQPGEKVLEIGTGSGFQTCVLCELGARVFTIERQKELYDTAGPLIEALGYKPQRFFGDGYKGKSPYAPFDKILVTCGAPFIPEDLVAQLKIGGRMVIPVGDGNSQKMIELIRADERTIHTREHGNFAFVPMLTDKAR